MNKSRYRAALSRIRPYLKQSGLSYSDYSGNPPAMSALLAKLSGIHKIDTERYEAHHVRVSQLIKLNGRDVVCQTPAWANKSTINAVYREAKRIGDSVHVDHVIPLQGRRVSGLHVAENLEIINAKDNLRKGNKFI